MIPKVPGGSNHKCSFFRLIALAARPLPSYFLLASSICCPLALQTYIYAIFSHHQSLHPEDGGSMAL